MPDIVFDETKWRTAVEEITSKNGWVIHPKRTMDFFLKLVKEKGGHCPCSPDSRVCPCEEIYQDMEERNACKCTIIVNHDYLVEWGYISGV